MKSFSMSNLSSLALALLSWPGTVRPQSDFPIVATPYFPDASPSQHRTLLMRRVVDPIAANKLHAHSELWHSADLFQVPERHHSPHHSNVEAADEHWSDSTNIYTHRGPKRWPRCR